MGISDDAEAGSGSGARRLEPRAAGAKKIKNNVKGSGQECPLHMSLQPAFGSGDARGFDAIPSSQFADGFGEIVAHGTVGEF